MQLYQPVLERLTNLTQQPLHKVTGGLSKAERLKGSLHLTSFVLSQS